MHLSTVLRRGSTALSVTHTWPSFNLYNLNKSYKTHFFNSTFSNLRIHVIPMFQDNYGYILHDIKENILIIIDPGDGPTLANAMSTLSTSSNPDIIIPDPATSLKAILCTHKHNDHIGGNQYLKDKFPLVDIIGPAYENDNKIIPQINMFVEEGNIFSIGNLKIEVFHVPCHTKGHIIYHMSTKSDGDNISILFTGDTLFAGGCGRFFEGSATDMVQNMNKITSNFSPNTFIYCAHEYTESNLRFLNSIDPQNIQSFYDTVKEVRKSHIPTIPTTLENELKYNLFIKCNEIYTQKLMGTNNAVDTMAKLRKLKNEFQ
eukprot:gene16002-21714_t